jgi:hypothetical protein
MDGDSHQNRSAPDLRRHGMSLAGVVDPPDQGELFHGKPTGPGIAPVDAAFLRCFHNQYLNRSAGVDGSERQDKKSKRLRGSNNLKMEARNRLTLTLPLGYHACA